MRFNFSKISFYKEYFLFLLPLFFVFHGYTYHFPLVPVAEGVTLLAIYVATIAILILLLHFFFKTWRNAALFTFCFMCFFFFFGVVHDAVKGLWKNSFFSTYSFVLPASFLMLSGLFLYLKKTKRGFVRITNYLNFLFLLLLTIDLVLLGFKIVDLNKENREANGTSIKKCDACPTPDIYFIIADEYAGAEELNDVFHVDNSAFLTQLAKRGFHVVPRSRSNYNYTPFSMASVLSMSYLEGITLKSNDPDNRNISYQKLTTNELIPFLKAHKYRFINLSPFDVANEPTPVNSMFFLTRENLIKAPTLSSRLNRDLRFHLVTKFRIKSELERLTYGVKKNNLYFFNQTIAASAAKDADPRFIYTHLMMPHYPYYYDKEGKENPLKLLTEGNQHNERLYIGYLQYCNKQFLFLIDKILKNSAKPPIILLMSDHGFRNFSRRVSPNYQFMNLNAIFLPHKNYASFHDSLSNVNQFRVLLNTQFNQQLPLLKDSTVFLYEY